MFSLLTELLAADLQLAVLFLFQFFVFIPYAVRRCCTATKRITFFSMTFILHFYLVPPKDLKNTIRPRSSARTKANLTFAIMQVLS